VRTASTRGWWVLSTGWATSTEGCPGFTISIGVLRDRMPFVGAVYDPVARWLFTGCAGRGAWVNDRPLHVVAASLLRSSLVALGNPLEAGVPPVVEEWLRRYRLRRVGSTALHLCYAALGALDLVHDHRTSLREVAGAAAVVLEAGGVVTLADNPTSHGQALAEVVPVVSACTLI
jgi:myo-inositol-1(or 4)-monophosphatase